MDRIEDYVETARLEYESGMSRRNSSIKESFETFLVEYTVSNMKTVCKKRAKAKLLKTPLYDTCDEDGIDNILDDIFNKVEVTDGN